LNFLTGIALTFIGENDDVAWINYNSCHIECLTRYFVFLDYKIKEAWDKNKIYLLTKLAVLFSSYPKQC
jgi:hypothetical protein